MKFMNRHENASYTRENNFPVPMRRHENDSNPHEILFLAMQTSTEMLFARTGRHEMTLTEMTDPPKKFIL